MKTTRSKRVAETLRLVKESSTGNPELPLWARAYRDVVEWTGPGKPTDKGQFDLLGDILAVHLPKFYSTPEGKAIVASREQAWGRLFAVATTGKDGHVGADDSLLAWAQFDLAEALASPDWQGYAVKAGPQFMARLGRRLEHKRPDLDADIAIVFLWTVPTPFLPPLCFCTDSAAASILSRATQNRDLSTATVKQWRRRWKLKAAPFKLLSSATGTGRYLTLA